MSLEPANPMLDDLRRRARAARRALPAGARADAAARVLVAVIGSAWWEGARTVAGYVAADGELDPGPVLAAARAAGKTVVLRSELDRYLGDLAAAAEDERAAVRGAARAR